METRSLEDRVMQSLARVRTEAGGPDVVDAGVVRSVTAGPDGEVRIGIALQPGVPRDIADTIRLVATGVIGVVRATVELADPASGPPEGSVPVQAAPAGTSGKGARRPLKYSMGTRAIPRLWRRRFKNFEAASRSSASAWWATEA